jgi:hypothetical protein
MATTTSVAPIPVLQSFYVLRTLRELNPEAQQAYDRLWGIFCAQGTAASSDAPEIINIGDPIPVQSDLKPPTPAQKILPVITAVMPKGLNIAEIALAAGLSEARVTTATAAMEKRGEIRQVGQRYFAVDKPARRRGRPAKTEAALSTNGAERQPTARKSAKAGATGVPSLSAAILQAVTAEPGATAPQILGYLNRTFGMTVRPNHAGIALQRHRRAGRLNVNGGKWSLPGARTADPAVRETQPLAQTG